LERGFDVFFFFEVEDKVEVERRTKRTIIASLFLSLFLFRSYSLSLYL